MVAGSSHDAPLPILPVILAGGLGARLAPISTSERPKPFIPLADGESLLTKTLARLRDPRFLPPVIIGRAADRFALMNHARAAQVAPAAILLEANGRNTAGAVALAVHWARAAYGDACVLAVLPADHVIAPEEVWRTALMHAAQACQQSDRLCLMSATATRPEPGFGYLLPGPASATRVWQPVVRFVEKPVQPQPLIDQGARWNMGQFIGTVGQFVQGLDQHAQATTQAAQQLLNSARTQWEYTELLPWPPTAQNLSFDHAVLEHIPSVTVPFTGQWQDLGDLASWRQSIGLDCADYDRQPPRTDRPWGYFEHRHTGDNEVHKRLILYPGCRLSRQKHQKRAEHWEVLAGTAHVELDDHVQRLEIHQSITIPAGCWHRLANYYSDILIIKEIQMGICDESDIERDEDDYGRN